MNEYLLGLATVPGVLFVSWLSYVVIHRSAATREWCECGEFDVRPQETGAPWWWYSLRWELHRRFNSTHRSRNA